MAIAKITKAYVHHYRDNGQTVAYVEWMDLRGKAGRTEGDPHNPHMTALFRRAQREGVLVELAELSL